MPKLKVPKDDKRRREVLAIMAAGQVRQGVSDNQLASRMCRTVRTLQNRRNNPDLFTLQELWAMCDALHLNANDRAAILGGNLEN
ncbi:MAG: hypothetical protein J1E83_12815 [Lachnospiraceae bacterium]|nr:hypothetical protein [Lachnospiraceae bacterium]